MHAADPDVPQPHEPLTSPTPPHPLPSCTASTIVTRTWNERPFVRHADASVSRRPLEHLAQLNTHVACAVRRRRHHVPRLLRQWGRHPPHGGGEGSGIKGGLCQRRSGLLTRPSRSALAATPRYYRGRSPRAGTCTAANPTASRGRDGGTTCRRARAAWHCRSRPRSAGLSNR